MMTPVHNSSISVDCVIFGYDSGGLKVLLVEREGEKDEYKLPGSLIGEDEDLETAADRTLFELTAVRGVNLRPLRIFSEPDRISGNKDLGWMHKMYGVDTVRIVTVAYYAIVKLTPDLVEHVRDKKQAFWYDTYNIRKLAFDHKQILMDALEQLYDEFIWGPMIFRLLPSKFTIRQVQDAYERIFDMKIDNRNFRKKLLSYPFLTPTGDWEKGVKHKPAQFYTFDHHKYERTARKKRKSTILQW